MPTIKIPFGALRTKSYAADRRRWRKQFIFLLSTFFLFAFDHREYCLGQLMLDEVRIEAFSVNNPFPAVLHLPVWTHLATTLAPCVSMCVCVPEEQHADPFQPNCSSYSKLLIAQKTGPNTMHNKYGCFQKQPSSISFVEMGMLLSQLKWREDHFFIKKEEGKKDAKPN